MTQPADRQEARGSYAAATRSTSLSCVTCSTTRYWRESDPEASEPVSRYVVNFGRRGDAAMIAIEDHKRIGAAWYRLFTRDEPGFAFVDEVTPEVSIAVVPSVRGRGIGSRLLEA